MMLPEILWILILEQLPLEDVVRVGSVNRSLFSIVRGLNRCSPDPRIPWLILPSRRKDKWKLYDIAADKVRRIHLPQLRDSVILGSSHGWLVVADTKTAKMRLFNPFNRSHLHLPPTTSLPKFIDHTRDADGRITDYKVYTGYWPVYTPHTPYTVRMTPRLIAQRYFESAHLDCFSTGYAVVLIYGMGLKKFMAFARSGEVKWTSIEVPLPEFVCKSFTFSKGFFYAMSTTKAVVSFDLRSGSRPEPVVLPLPPTQPGGWFRYMVGMPDTGHLVHVGGNYDIGFRFFKMDPEEGEWLEVANFTDLGGISLFMAAKPGFGSVTGVSLKLPEHHPRVNQMFFATGGSLQVYDMNRKSCDYISQFSWHGSDQHQVKRYKPSTQTTTSERESRKQVDGLLIIPVITELAPPGSKVCYFDTRESRRGLFLKTCTAPRSEDPVS